MRHWLQTRGRVWGKRTALASVLAVVVAVASDALFFRGNGARPAHIVNAAPLFVEGAAPPSESGRVKGTALLVNGGYGFGKNHRRYWNNLALLYRTLRRVGWTKLVALDADGSSGVPDRNVRSFLGVTSTGSYEDSPLDLDGDGVSDVSGPGSKASLEKALESIGKGLAADEPVAIFFTDHGQLRRKGTHVSAVAMMWNEEMTGTEFDAMLRRTVPEKSWIFVVAMQCHGAIFLSEVTRPRTAFIAAGAPLWIWSDQDYSVFPYHFSAALLGKDPSTLATREADDDRDGRVSFMEAFRSASEHDHVPEWPRAWVTDGSGEAPALFGK